ncbi:OLC1v1002155C1 [Oldenlandia corymbosa var. corymbosa]|uniref:OLC1v1002155C1 n=1 Tax=Oldenlandia corymbosa var. corymbosa TaxID=529605 RepID=A0AAV1D6Z7_OLDCO|nr:OLC1v1002155C1 [Oldenlandia corymbosa var. corymbosa]
MRVSDSNGSPNPTRLEGKITALVVCWVLGLGSLLAWNTLLTIGDYYYELFPRYHPARVLTLIYQPLGLVTMIILTSQEAKIDTRKRNLAGYTLFFLSTFGLLLLDIGTSGKGGTGSYVAICILVAGYGIADSLASGGMVGDLSFMCPEFIQSFFAGLAASGALTSGLRLMTKAAFEKSHNGLRKGAIMFLAISTLIEFLCVLLYKYVFPKLPIVKHFRSKAALEGSKTVKTDLVVAGIHKLVDDETQMERLSTKQLLWQNIDYALDLFLVYGLTFSIIPGFLYENTGSHKLGSWYPLVLITMYNVFNFISRYIPLIECLKIKNRKILMLVVLSRLFLIPAFYFTAKYGDQGWMIMLTSLVGLTNGYLTVCVFTAAPKGYKGPEQNALGNLLFLFLDGGLTSGVALDWLWLIGNGIF